MDGIRLNDDNMCFACSPKNPIGLKLKFEYDGEVCRTTFVPGVEHQGWAGVMHGGLITTLLDEVMAQWLWSRGIIVMTAEMTVRFRTAVQIGQRLIVEAKKLAERKRLFELAAQVILPNGKVAARAVAKFLKSRQV